MEGYEVYTSYREKRLCISIYTPMPTPTQGIMFVKASYSSPLRKKSSFFFFSLNPVRVEHHPTCSNMTYSINIKQMHGSKECKEIHHTVLQGLTVKFKKNYTYQIWIYIKF